LPDRFQIEFDGTQFWTPPLEEGKPPNGRIAIYFENPFSASRLYGYNNETTEYGFRRMSVDASGVSTIDAVGNLISGFYVDMEYDGGRIFSTTGRVIDPEARTLIGTFTGISFALVRPDTRSGRVFFLTVSGSRGTLIAFNDQTFVPVDTLTINGVSETPGSFIR
jgi:hypothetical protein